MSARASYFKIGVFVITAATLAVAGVIALGAGALLKSTILLESYIDESVQGLEVGSPVKHRGVTIGSVRDIDFAYNRYEFTRSEDRFFEFGRYVVVEIALERGTFGEIEVGSIQSVLDELIEQGLRVRMAATGLTGQAYLEVDYVDPARNPPPPIDWKPDALYIPAAPSTIGRLLSTAEEILSQLARVDVKRLSEKAERLLTSVADAVEEAGVGGLREEMLSLLEEARGTNARLKEILSSPEMDSILAGASETMASTREILGGSQQSLSEFLEDLPEISSRLESITTKLDTSLEQGDVESIIEGVRVAAEELPIAVERARRLIDRLDGLVSEQEGQIEATLRSLRSLTEDLEQFGEVIRSQPSQALFGEPPPKRNPGAKP